MNIINYTTLLIGAFLICSSPLVADEYITLTTIVEPEGTGLLEKTAKDLGPQYQSEGINELVEFFNNNNSVKKSEATYDIKSGEVVELEHMIHISLGGGDLPKINELNQGRHTWNGQYNYSNAAHKVEVKFPFHDNWFQFSYNTNSKTWSGLNTSNPLIIGPCKIKLTKLAGIGFYSSGNHNETSTITRFGYRHYGGTVWLSFKKRAKGNSGTSSNKAQSLVLPEGSGDLTIIMEGSNDLINWTREDLGKKPEANRKTFYRIRAVKE